MVCVYSLNYIIMLMNQYCKYITQHSYYRMDGILSTHSTSMLTTSTIGDISTSSMTSPMDVSNTPATGIYNVTQLHDKNITAIASYLPTPL